VRSTHVQALGCGACMHGIACLGGTKTQLLLLQCVRISTGMRGAASTMGTITMISTKHMVRCG